MSVNGMTGIKLAAIDLDGTLLNDRKRLSRLNAETIQSLLTQEVIVVLVSARDYASMHLKVPLTHPGLYFIASGGTLAYEVATNSIIWDTHLPAEVVATSVRFLKRYNEPVFLNAVNDYWVDRINQRVKMIEARYSLSVRLFKDVHDIDRRVMRVSLAAPIGVLQRATADANARLGQHVNVGLASPDWLDLLPLDAGKGLALSLLQSKFGIGPEQTVAIGDYDCDLSMFDYAQYGIAMGNAVPAVKAAATHVTVSNNDDGVARALHWLMKEA